MRCSLYIKNKKVIQNGDLVYGSGTYYHNKLMLVVEVCVDWTQSKFSQQSLCLTCDNFSFVTMATRHLRHMDDPK